MFTKCLQKIYELYIYNKISTYNKLILLQNPTNIIKLSHKVRNILNERKKFREF